MMLVDGFRWFVGLGGWFVCVSLWIVGDLVELDVALLVVMMSLDGGLLGGWSCDRLLEDGWVAVVLMVGKYISMVVCDRRRRDLLVRAGGASWGVGS